jgi:hypothetical protein
MSDPKRPAPDPRQGPFDSEIDTRAIVKFLVWLVLGVAIVVGGIRLLEWRLEAEARRTDVPPSPLVDRTERRLPPEPRLQATPELDLQAYRAEERRRAASWGWVDEKAGVVHIPVERAMDIVAARGLPARPQPGTNPVPAPAAGPAAARSSDAPSGGRP